MSSLPEPPAIQGTINFPVSSASIPCKTWYTIFGPPLTPISRPLIILHGGPGAAHNYLLPIRHLASTLQQPIILYDQLGCGNSTHLPQKSGDGEFWTIQLFLSELNNLLTTLKITSYDLLGQSWGGMLGAEHAVLQPKGLRRLIIADSTASMVTWVKVANELREKLPTEVQETLLKHEKDETTESEEYEAAMEVFYSRHLCRLNPTPQEMIDTFAQLKAEPTVYHTMNGPSEFHITGTLKTWTIESRLHTINVPTLLINGKYDEATDEAMEPFFREIGKVKWVRFAESSHMPQLEEPEEFLVALENFLRGV